MRLLGGAKKRSLKQTEKQQELRTKKLQKDQRRTRSDSKTFNKKRWGIDISSLSDKDLAGDFSKMKAITPYLVASKYDVRLSTAKNLLETLEKRGLIQLVAMNSNLKLYRVGEEALA